MHNSAMCKEFGIIMIILLSLCTSEVKCFALSRNMCSTIQEFKP